MNSAVFLFAKAILLMLDPNSFEAQTIRLLSSLDTKVGSIDEGLKMLGARVVEQDEKIQEQEKQLSVIAVEHASNKRWISILTPAMYAVGIAFLALVLYHANEMSKLLGK